LPEVRQISDSPQGELPLLPSPGEEGALPALPPPEQDLAENQQAGSAVENLWLDEVLPEIENALAQEREAEDEAPAQSGEESPDEPSNPGPTPPSSQDSH
jgi:hypothetical protein